VKENDYNDLKYVKELILSETPEVNISKLPKWKPQTNLTELDANKLQNEYTNPGGKLEYFTE
jgi:hypothetical protein